MGDDTSDSSATHDIVNCVYHSKIRGYHIYKEIWMAAIGEPLSCRRETGNLMDPYAVVVIKAGEVVGHIPHSQFPSVKGYKLTLLQDKPLKDKLPTGSVQIIHNSIGVTTGLLQQQ